MELEEVTPALVNKIVELQIAGKRRLVKVDEFFTTEGINSLDLIGFYGIWDTGERTLFTNAKNPWRGCLNDMHVVKEK